MSPDQRLGCGADIDQVWGNIHQPPTEHEAGCPECTAARADLAQLAAATRDYRQDDAEQQSNTVASPDVVSRIVELARAEVRYGRRIPLMTPTPGDDTRLSVSEQAVATAARAAADAHPQVQVRRCAVRLHPAPAATLATTDPDTRPVPGEVSTVALRLRISISRNARMPDLEQHIRDAVTNAVMQQIGLRVARVDLSVEDLHDG